MSQHGTPGRYRLGCRCRHCRSENARRAKQWRLQQTSSSTTAGIIDATGTHRRIRGLAALGWPMPTISTRAGLHPRRAYQILYYQRVRASTAQAIDAVYTQLAMTPGPSARAATWARKRGWAPPLAWDNIDNPAERAKPRHPSWREAA